MLVIPLFRVLRAHAICGIYVRHLDCTLKIHLLIGAPVFFDPWSNVTVQNHHCTNSSSTHTLDTRWPGLCKSIPNLENVSTGYWICSGGGGGVSAWTLTAARMLCVALDRNTEMSNILSCFKSCFSMLKSHHYCYSFAINPMWQEDRPYHHSSSAWSSLTSFILEPLICHFLSHSVCSDMCELMTTSHSDESES